MPGSVASRPRLRAGRGPPRPGRGRAGTGSAGGQAVYTRREGSSSAREGTGGRRQPGGTARGGARTSEALRPAEPRQLAHLGGLRRRFPSSGTASRPGPSKTPSGRFARNKVSFCNGAERLTWEPGHQRAEPKEAGVQGRRGPRHGGAPASAAARAAGSAGACVPGRCARAEGRGPQLHARRAAGTHSARGPAGVGGGCAGPRPTATIPPAALAAESRGSRCPGSPARTPRVPQLQTAPDGGSEQGRGWLRSVAATWAPGRAPR